MAVDNLQDTFGDQDYETISGTLAIDNSSEDGVLITTKITGSVQVSGMDSSGEYSYEVSDMNLSGTSDSSNDAYSGGYDGNVSESGLGAFGIVTVTKFSGVEPAMPDTGVAKATANDGYSVTLTVQDATNISLEVDTDGDGIIDGTVNTTLDKLGES